MATPPRLPLMLSLCLLVAVSPLAGAATLGDSGQPLADGAIFAWEISARAPGGNRTGHAGAAARGAQSGAAGDAPIAVHDRTILHIINGSDNAAEVFWETSKASTGTLSDATLGTKMDWSGIHGGELMDGRFGTTTPDPAVVTAGKSSAGAEPFYQTPTRGELVALAGVMFVAPLLALRGFVRQLLARQQPAPS